MWRWEGGAREWAAGVRFRVRVRVRVMVMGVGGGDVRVSGKG